MEYTATIGTYREHGRKYRVDITVDLREKRPAAPYLTVDGDYIPGETTELAITHETWDTRDKRDPVSLGAGASDAIAMVTDFAPGWDASKAARLIELSKWHLNAMSPACAHQIAEGWDKRPIDPQQPTNRYGKFFDGQRLPSWNMLAWVSRSEHPEGLLSHPCDTCGYKYGTAWLVKPLPDEVVAEVKALFQPNS